MAEAKKYIYPVDIDQFATIREQGKLYVDKTDLMFDLVHTYNYVFLSRPRRFGKSLFCTTLKAYFEGRKDLFEGLKLMPLEQEWKTYPVLHFSMSGLKNLSAAEAKGKLELLLKGYEAIYGEDPDERTPGARFRGLIHRACQQCGEKVVILLDEYDAPIMRLLHASELDDMRTLLREFYQVLKDEGAYLRFVFMTGVTKFSQLSIFSELNNLMNISMLDEYSGICGITETEMTTTLRPCLQEWAEGQGCSVEEAYALFRKQYDGYRFSNHSQEVYSPFSVLRALQTGELNDYWFESATMTSLLEHMAHYPHFNLLNLDGIEVDLDEFNIPCENASTPIPLLYQSGYLSIQSYDKRLKSYILHFPNEEVRQGLIKGLMPSLIYRQPDEYGALSTRMARAIYDGDLNGALEHLRAYIAGIPYDIITKEEWDEKATREAFYKLLFYMTFSMLNSKVDTEVKSVLGRADVVIRTKSDIFVLELKVDDTVEHALRQIDEKGYAIPWIADGRRVTKCGVRIDSAVRNIAEWKMA